MESATYVAMSRQTVLAKSMDMLANNVANLSTTGFRAEEPLFRQYLATGPSGKPIAYVEDGGLRRDFKQGALTPTANSLDAGIEGTGFFSIGTAAGTRYSRNGHFELNGQGQVVTANGDTVLDDRGSPITVPASAAHISITEDGTISADGGPVGKLGVVTFADDQQLNAEGNNLFSTTQAGTPDTESHVRQGMLEGSNVQPVVEMTRLLQVQRAYTSAEEILDAEDTRQKTAIDKLAKVA